MLSMNVDILFWSPEMMAFASSVASSYCPSDPFRTVLKLKEAGRRWFE
jgi:hypothetical protein